MGEGSETARRDEAAGDPTRHGHTRAQVGSQTGQEGSNDGDHNQEAEQSAKGGGAHKAVEHSPVIGEHIQAEHRDDDGNLEIWDHRPHDEAG
jgi:hypothetical protein